VAPGARHRPGTTETDLQRGTDETRLAGDEHGLDALSDVKLARLRLAMGLLRHDL
jgi:hypothetical protein